MKAKVATLNIDSSDIQKWIPKLDKIHRSAFPIAVRKTLNAAAMDVKQMTMPMESDKAFKKRKPTFWSATSHVEYARGFDVNKMSAQVGFIAPKNIKESGYATKDLEEQEKGGNIDKRAFIATEAGRTAIGNVRDKFTMKTIKPMIVDAKGEEGKNAGEKFIKAALKAGVGNFVITPWANMKNSKYLALIQKIQTTKAKRSFGNKSPGGTVISYKEIYTVKKGRKAHVKRTDFMQKSALDTVRHMAEMFHTFAEDEFNKVRVK